MFFKIISMVVVVLLIGGCTTHSPSANYVDVTDKDLRNLKSGTACGKYILGVFGPFGEESIVTAVRNGNIKKIKAIDKSTDSFILFSQNCITVYGE